MCCKILPYHKYLNKAVAVQSLAQSVAQSPKSVAESPKSVTESPEDVAESVVESPKHVAVFALQACCLWTRWT
jgi:hypothetical protein